MNENNWPTEELTFQQACDISGKRILGVIKYCGDNWQEMETRARILLGIGLLILTGLILLAVSIRSKRRKGGR